MQLMGPGPAIRIAEDANGVLLKREGMYISSWERVCFKAVAEWVEEFIYRIHIKESQE